MSKMTREEWDRTLTEGFAKHNEQKGIRKPAPIQGQGNFHPYQYPLCNRTITNDMIRIFTTAIGDPNPLWTNEEYAAKTRFGGIIAPPLCEIMIAENAAGFPPIEIDGYSQLNGGSTREYFTHIRPGDTFTAEDVYLGNEEKTNPDKPYRLFRMRKMREFFNQRGELVVRVTGTSMVTARYPGDDAVKQEKRDFRNAKMRWYTDKELAEIHAMYDDELAGKNRRGAEILYWENVNIGDELKSLPLGPYDLSDAVSFFGVTGYSQAFASKWQALRNDIEGGRRDPNTNELSISPIWHFDNDVAHVAGAKLAPIFGTHIETCLAHVVTNWMGDDGELKKISCRIQRMAYLGDTLICKGKVIEKRQENGESLVEVELSAEQQLTGEKCTVATATVSLLSRS